MRHLDEHLDDGLIHALLDGELEGEELASARAHVLVCDGCSTRLAEARLLSGEADRLISELEGVGGSPAGPGAAPPPPDSPQVKGPPVVLIPQPEDNRWQRRQAPSRAIGIAATIAIAAGAGFFALSGDGDSTFAAADSVVTDMPPVAAPETRGFALTDSGASPVPPAADTDARPVETELVAPESSRQALPKPQADAGRLDLAGGESKAVEAPSAKATNEVQERAQGRAEPEVVAAAPREEDTRAAETSADARRRSEPIAQRAAETAPATVGAAAAAPAPEPPSLEQRAQISMRIGLDEAQRLLGGPMHVIDGMRHELVGLVPGRLVRGANPNDYVVRVVYLDDRGQPFYLNQQRLDLTARQMGAQRDTVPPDWVIGDVRVSISGQVTSEAARALARRVR